MVEHKKVLSNITGGIMNQGEKNQPKKILLRVRIEGRKKPVTKEALVCRKSKKIIKFL